MQYDRNTITPDLVGYMTVRQNVAAPKKPIQTGNVKINFVGDMDSINELRERKDFLREVSQVGMVII